MLLVERNMLHGGRPLVPIPMRPLDSLFNLPDLSSRTLAVYFAQPLTEMTTRVIPEGKARSTRKADIAICESTV
jgi:hypothetical protein